MEIRKIYVIEIKKIMKKPITAVLLVSFILPLFYGISTYIDASYLALEGEFNILLLATSSWIMLQYICLPQVLLALLSIQNFAYELENGQIKMVLIKGCGRTKLLLSKILVNLTLLIALYITFHLFSCLVFYLSSGSFKFSEMVFWILADGLRFLLMDMIYLINIFIISNIVVCLSLYYTPFTSFMMGVGVSFMVMLLQYFPVIKYFVPMYVADQLTTQTISITLATGAFCIYIIVPNRWRDG